MKLGKERNRTQQITREKEAGVTKQEKKIIQGIIGDMLDDKGSFIKPMGRLCKLVGWRYPIADIRTTPTTVAEIIQIAGKQPHHRWNG